MKYGETLRQRSIPAWSHYNIDYDDIKHFIKEHTTPGKGKAVAVPGRGDEQLGEFENSLFLILADQHQRINLFVKSKAGEIQRRIDHSKKQLRQLASRRTPTKDNRIPVSRLERYGKLETDVIQAGEEIRSLARFIAAQRTGFRKLLKKSRKWTNSAKLVERFRGEVLDDPKSFTRLDLGYLLDDYSATQQGIRALYESQLQQSKGNSHGLFTHAPIEGSSTIRQLLSAVETGSKVFFDTSVATVPLGVNGTFASYFVHPENVVELQMLLLQFCCFHHSRSRANSVATPVTSTPAAVSPGADVPDYHILAADNLNRFAKEQSSSTVIDREHLPGSFPQRAKVSIRWNDTEDALSCVRSRSGRTKSAYLKRKHIQDFFDKTAKLSTKQDIGLAESLENVEEVRSEILKEEIAPLFHYSCCRSRLTGLDDGPDGLALATLDTGITISQGYSPGEEEEKSPFPFALLLVRQEGTPKSDLLAALDDSYLVERVRGFSVEYHSVWQTHKPATIPAPFWLPMLSQDIRKLPPPAMKSRRAGEGVSSSGSNTVESRGSVVDSTTAVERETTSTASQLESPPLKSFRKKKKKRAYVQAPPPQERYWSEYDHPEDGDESGNAYVIFIDPNEKSMFDTLFDKFTALFRNNDAEKDPLLSPHPEDEVSSDEDDESTPRGFKPTTNGFGTFASSQPSQAQPTNLSQFSWTCFAASLSILVVAYILHSTGKHKLLREVQYGVLFAIVCSLGFMIVGFMAVVRSPRPVSWATWTVSGILLVVDAVGSGGLVAWMLG